jgi:flagellar biosynthesis protein FlhG
VATRFLGNPSLDYLGWIPFDPHVPKAVRQQQPVMHAFPQAPASGGFVRLAETIWNDPKQVKLNGNIKFFWRRLLNL